MVKVAPDSQRRTGTVIEFGFTSSKLNDGKMMMEIFEGFTFNNFSNNDYNVANLTTHLPYPHQKDFDKNKFQDVMVGDVLLAGTKQENGTVTANDTLRLTGVNFLDAIPHRFSIVLPYVSPETSAKDNNAWCYVKLTSGYPQPILPCWGTGRITITLLTHNFDNETTGGRSFPPNIVSFEYRLVIYKQSLSEATHVLFSQIDYKGLDIKRGGSIFFLNKRLLHNPSSECIGFRLEFRQTAPTNGWLGNESQLFFSVQQEV